MARKPPKITKQQRLAALDRQAKKKDAARKRLERQRIISDYKLTVARLKIQFRRDYLPKTREARTAEVKRTRETYTALIARARADLAEEIARLRAKRDADLQALKEGPKPRQSTMMGGGVGGLFSPR